MVAMMPSIGSVGVSHVPANASQTPTSTWVLDQQTQNIIILDEENQEKSAIRDTSTFGDHECPELGVSSVNNAVGGQVHYLKDYELPTMKATRREDEDHGSINRRDFEKVAVANNGLEREIPDSDAVSQPSSVEVMEGVFELGNEDADSEADVGEECVIEDRGKGVDLVSASQADEAGKMEEYEKGGVEAPTMITESKPAELTRSEPLQSTLWSPLLARLPISEEGVHQLDDRLLSATPDAPDAPRCSAYNQNTSFEDALVRFDAVEDDLAQPSNLLLSSSKSQRQYEDNVPSPIEEAVQLRCPSPDVLGTLIIDHTVPKEGATFLQRALLVDEALAAKTAEDLRYAKAIPPNQIPASDDEKDAMDQDQDPRLTIFETHGSTAKHPDTFVMDVLGMDEGERSVVIVSSIIQKEAKVATEASLDDSVDIVPDTDNVEASGTTLSTNDLEKINVTTQLPTPNAMDLELENAPKLNSGEFEPGEAATTLDKLQHPPRLVTSELLDVRLNDPPSLSDKNLGSAEVSASLPTTIDVCNFATIKISPTDLSKGEISAMHSSEEEPLKPEPVLRSSKKGKGRPRIKSREKTVETKSKSEIGVEVVAGPELEPEVEIEPELQPSERGRGKPKIMVTEKVARPEPKPDEPEGESEPGLKINLPLSDIDEQSQASPLVQEPTVSVASPVGRKTHDAQATKTTSPPWQSQDDNILPPKAAVTPNVSVKAPNWSKSKVAGSGNPSQMIVKSDTHFISPDGLQKKRKLGTTTPSKVASLPQVASAAVDNSPEKDVLFDELKAMKIASIQARNTSLETEVSNKRARLERITKDLENPAAETVKRHIRLLHDYNDIRDVGQGLVGMIADNRGVRIGDLYDEFGVGLKD